MSASLTPSAVPDDLREMARTTWQEAMARFAAFTPNEASIDAIAAALLQVRNAEREACAAECEAEASAFLSPEYTTGQPLNSAWERFACAECAAAIRARA